jgi:hypothetical protein
MIAGDRQDIADAAALQKGPELGVGTVDLIAGHPTGRDPESRARASIRLARAALVANRAWSGTPAARRRLHPPEPARDPAQQLLQPRLPARRGYAVACGHCVIFGCPHTTGSSPVAAPSAGRLKPPSRPRPARSRSPVGVLTREVLSVRHEPIQRHSNAKTTSITSSTGLQTRNGAAFPLVSDLWSPPAESNRRYHPYHGTTGKPLCRCSFLQVACDRKRESYMFFQRTVMRSPMRLRPPLTLR